MARNIETGAVKGDRLPGPKPLRRRQPGKPGAWPRAHPGTCRRHAARPKSARLGVPARPQIAIILDRAARLAPADGNLRSQDQREHQTQNGRKGWKKTSEIAILIKRPV